MPEIQPPKYKEYTPEELEKMSDSDFILELDKLLLLFNKI